MPTLITEPKPYFIGGFLDGSGNIEQGFPGTLSAGSAFLAGCVEVFDSNPQDDLLCSG